MLYMDCLLAYMEHLAFIITLNILKRSEKKQLQHWTALITSGGEKKKEELVKSDLTERGMRGV